MIPFKQKKKNIPEQKMRSQRCWTNISLVA
jgi:hypothetical protein